MKDGGLRVRRVSSLALPAFLASAAGTFSLQADILADCACSDNDSLQSYLSDWSLCLWHSSGRFLPPKQPFWDRSSILADVAQVKSGLSTPAQLASSHIVETGFRQCQYRHVG